MICLGRKGIAEYYLGSRAGIALIRTSWVDWHRMDLIGCPSVVRARVWVVFVVGGGGFQVLSCLSLILVPEIRSTNLVKSWIF
jgi:hypothetical protein